MATNSANEYSPIVVYGTKKYVEYHPGGVDSKLILSVSHGGKLCPKTIPNRTENPEKRNLDPMIELCVKADVYTKEIALQLREELVKVLPPGSEPHMIICNVHRTRLDMNRNVFEACLNDPEALVAYDEYYGFLSKAKETIGKGLLLDIHGHSHREELTELGYLLKHRDLLRNDIHPETSSIRTLASTSNLTFEEIVCGSASLGKFLNDQGIEAVPSPRHKISKGNYFTGGYIVNQHGSLRGGDIDAIQVEIHRKYRCVDKSAMFVFSLAHALKEYLTLHYDISQPETN